MLYVLCKLENHLILIFLYTTFLLHGQLCQQNQDAHINRGEWAQFEGFVADCLTSGSADKASLSWEFFYESESKTKPYEASYTAKFSGGDGSDPECVAASKTFPNE